ncbi:MAG TPA: hypothetical protein VFR29_11470 [Steroidobacteraceae bacterium]|nr:hypothetical protein [Steroidobacteraceae bacterium]
MNRAATRIVALLTGLALAAPAMAAWKEVADGTPFVHKNSGYSIQYPAGWRWIKLPFGDETIASRDGPSIHAISVDYRKHRKAFRALNQDSTPDMAPQELAQKIIAEATQARQLQNVEILSDEPVVVAGRPGFRVLFSYRTAVDAGSLRYREFVVGTNSPQGIFIISYRAPVLQYFDRDVETFEKALATFTIADKAPKR